MSTSTRTFLTNLSNSISSSDFREIFLDTLSGDVIWTATGTSLLSGRYEGNREYITKVLQPLYDRLEASPKPEVEHMIVDCEWPAVQFRIAGSCYDFWAKKTHARIHDPRKRDIIAPLEPPHTFGTKRPLEQDFHEQFSKDNVDVIDIKASPIVEIRPEGILTSDGMLHELDVIALATGFDSVTGGMKNMGLRNIYGEALSDTRKMGTQYYLGMTCNGYSSMFFLYGAQGPTAFSNGPSCVEVQGDWIVDAIKKVKDEDVKSINPTKAAEEAWQKNVKEPSDKTLFPGTASWYMGANVPGKPREQLNYADGIPLYEECRRVLKNWVGLRLWRRDQ